MVIIERQLQLQFSGENKKMHKKVIAIVFILLISSMLFAESFFSTYGAAYNVNLADSETFCGVDDDNPVYGSSAGYSDATHIALIGVYSTSSPSTVNIKFNNTDWMYQSASQPNLKRPFGIFLVQKERYKKDYYILDWDSESDHIIAVRNLGYDKNGNLQSDSSSFDFKKPTDHSYIIDSQFAVYEEYLIGSWVDIVLVLPKIDPNDTSYTVGSADDYYASFDIEVSGGASASYHCEFTGWYEQEKEGDVSFILNVVPIDAASSIDLDDTARIENGGDGVKIGDYSYSTTHDSSESASNHEYFAFVSSSLSPMQSSGNFELVLETQTLDATGNNSTVPFEIGLQSDDSSKDIKWFDGNVNMYDAAAPDGARNTFYSSRERVMSQIGDDPTLYQYYDDGNIRFRLADGADTTNLLQGIYKSNVYFHVVAWK